MKARPRLRLRYGSSDLRHDPKALEAGIISFLRSSFLLLPFLRPTVFRPPRDVGEAFTSCPLTSALRPPLSDLLNSSFSLRTSDTLSSALRLRPRSGQDRESQVVSVATFVIRLVSVSAHDDRCAVRKIVERASDRIICGVVNHGKGEPDGKNGRAMVLE